MLLFSHNDAIRRQDEVLLSQHNRRKKTRFLIVFFFILQDRVFFLFYRKTIIYAIYSNIVNYAEPIDSMYGFVEHLFKVAICNKMEITDAFSCVLIFCITTP